MELFEYLIENNKNESEMLDYKSKIDFIENKVDFLKGIIAFANSSYNKEHYIVYGVKAKSGKLELIGLNSSITNDDAEIQQLVYENIEPNINISFSWHKYQDKGFLVLTIGADKNQRPFMLKKNYKNLYKGDSWIRIGTSKTRMVRSDYEIIYKTKILPINVSLRDYELYINDQEPAKLEIIMKNHSKVDRLFTSIFLIIEDDKEKQLIISKMLSFKSNKSHQSGTYESDFSLSIPKQSEIIGIAEFSFSSSQAAIVGLNEFGESDIRYVFKLVFRYEESKEYIFKFMDCSIFARGAILRKIAKTK